MSRELVPSVRAIDRNGQMVAPEAELPWCDHPGCTSPAPFGFEIGGKVMDYCNEHRLEGERA